MLLNLESGAYAFTADPDEGTVSIGRENDCNFIVKEDGVSRHHCKLWFENGQWMVEDTGSRHGTVINNKQAHKPVPLHSGDVLRLSTVAFVVSLHVTNDPKEIGKQLAGGAREKLKLLNQPGKPKGAPAKPTRIMKAPGKGSNPKLKPALSEESSEEPQVEPAAEIQPVSETDTAAASSTDSEDSPEGADGEQKTASKVRPGAKGPVTAKSRTKGGKPAKETKNSGGMLKIIAAVVIFLGAGAGAYYGLGMNVETPSTPDGKTDNKPAETLPAIPAKPGETPTTKDAAEPKAEPKSEEKVVPAQ